MEKEKFIDGATECGGSALGAVAGLKRNEQCRWKNGYDWIIKYKSYRRKYFVNSGNRKR